MKDALLPLIDKPVEVFFCHSMGGSDSLTATLSKLFDESLMLMSDAYYPHGVHVPYANVVAVIHRPEFNEKANELGDYQSPGEGDFTV